MTLLYLLTFTPIAQLHLLHHLTCYTNWAIALLHLLEYYNDFARTYLTITLLHLVHYYIHYIITLTVLLYY